MPGSTSRASRAAAPGGRPSLLVVEGAPLADGTQHENGDHAHAPGCDKRPDEHADAAADAALAAALQAHDREADEPAGGAAEEDRCEGGRPRCWRRKGRQWAVRLGHAEERILGGSAQHGRRPHI